MNYIIKLFVKFIYKWFLIIKTNGRILSFIHFNTKLGKKVIIGENVKSSKQISYIGNYTFIHSDVVLDFVSHIGAYCSISRGVKIGLGAHPKSLLSTSPAIYSKERGFVEVSLYESIKSVGLCEIGDDVLISANVLILAGVKIGTGAIIGANAVVVKDVPPYSIVVGVPARVVGYRFEQNVVSDLLESSWWEKDINEVLEFSDIFKNKYENKNK